MVTSRLLLLLQLLTLQSLRPGHAASGDEQHEYCVVGAGPSGLQLAYYMQTAGRDYVVLEQNAMAGSFFTRYPRHDTLISLNKRWADSRNTEYRMRHDWNSLISNDSRLQFRHYSDIMFPHREVMVKYLDDFYRVHGLNVRFNSSVESIRKPGSQFDIALSDGRRYTCDVVVIATGVSKMATANFPGVNLTVGYDEVSTNRSDFEGQRVLIIGKGNSGFETAQHIYGNTKFVHVVGKHAVRFAWSTHYVGDLRAVNNELLDTYQLKSLDGMFESDQLAIVRNSQGELCLQPPDGKLPRSGGNAEAKHTAQHYCYDTVIRANGFVWDSTLARELNTTTVLKGKYPRVSHQYESPDVPNLFFAGTCTHSLDFRQSSGGFVHGFRYTSRALHRYLEVRRHGKRWPGSRGPTSQLLDTLMRRINEGSGTYQMFGFLGDVVVMNRDKTEFALIEEFPVKLLHILPRVTGHTVDSDVFVFLFEYGRNFSGPRFDTFNERRAGCLISEGHKCNFLHPVIYHYTQLPNKSQMFDPSLKARKLKLPKPARVLHLVEDFFTSFKQESHIVPLASFLERALEQPTAPVSAEQCVRETLLMGETPPYCRGARWSINELLQAS